MVEKFNLIATKIEREIILTICLISHKNVPKVMTRVQQSGTIQKEHRKKCQTISMLTWIINAMSVYRVGISVDKSNVFNSDFINLCD